MPGVTATIDVKIGAELEGTSDLGNPKVANSFFRLINLKQGTDATNKADVMWSDTRTIAASGTDTLDLTGTLTGLLGGTVSMAEVIAIYIEAASTNVNNVVIGGAASNAFVGPFGANTHTVKVAPGEYQLFASQSGWAVTAATGDILQIANSGAGTAVTYNIIIIGRTVAA